MDRLEEVMESLVRISFAGFGGSLVGMAMEHQQQQLTAPQQQRLPPNVLRRAGKTSGTPMAWTWAVSCSIFVFLLESSRKTSPTTTLIQAVEHYQQMVSSSTTTVVSLPHYQTKALTTMSDMALGGSVAGLAGSTALRNRQFTSGLVPRNLAMWGWSVGLGLGLLAGIFQAAADIGDDYLLQQKKQQAGGDAETAAKEL